MDLYSKYVQMEIYGQVLHEEFPVIHEKGLNYFFRRHPQLPFLKKNIKTKNYSNYQIFE